MTVFHRRVSGFCAVLILLALILSPVPGFAAEKKASAPPAKPAVQPSTDKSDDLPPPELTLGTRAGDGVVEGYGDILAPILALKSGIVFINPRATLNDHSAEEYNLGVGYRHLLRDKGMILGANMYYDYRETESGGRFNQVGFGLEYLSDWVDARANYYLPENHTETVESEVTTVNQSDVQYTKWGDPAAQGNTIYQNGTFYKGVTTTEITQHFTQYEEAMEGWDAELGVRLPIPVVMDYADVKVFGGYYHYNRDFGLDDLNGFKGRMEIKAMPSLYLDAEVFDSKDLTGRDFYLGARVSVPFDVANISKGRNPFAGAIDGMKVQQQKTTIASRLTEMVMRDLHVQTEYSEATEEVTKRTSVSTTQITNSQKVSDTLATDVIFVNQDTGNDGNPGTIELPVAQIPTGIDRGSNVFVMATVGPYLVNLQIGKNVNLMGQGFPIGHDGKYLNGDSRYAVIKGMPFLMGGKSSGGPTVFVSGYGEPNLIGLDGANDVKIRGFDIQNELAAAGLGQGAAAIPLLDMMAVGVDGVQNFELAYNKLNNATIGLGALYDGIPQFNLNVHDNVFDNLGVGAGVVAFESQGSMTFSRNTIQNTLIGLVGAAVGADPSMSAVLNAQITDNVVRGGGLGVVTTTSALDIGPLDLQDIMPIDLSSLGVKTDAPVPPEDLPSLSALNVAALALSGDGPAVVNATFTGNVIEDNLLGIGAVGMGPNASVNANIQNNTLRGGGLAALIGDISFSGLVPEETIDGSGIGIWMLGLNGAMLNNAVIAGNTITDHVLGIGVLGLGEAQMNNGLIANNTISDSLLGIVIAGVGQVPTDFKSINPVEEPVVQMNNWTITGNRISGNGVGQIVGEILPIIPTNIIPQNVSDALQAVAIPDTGLAGILVVGVAPDLSTLGVNNNVPALYTTEMNGYQITGNTVENELLGVGVVGVGSDSSPFKSILVSKRLEMNDYTISGNTIRNNLLGLLVAGVTYVDMQNYNITQNNLQGNVIGVAAVSANNTDQSGLWIHNNTIVGGNLDDAFSALQPLADTNIIDDIDIVNLLKLPLPDTGAIGVVVLTDYADADNVSIDHNTISKNLVGVLVAGIDEAGMDGLNVANNTINGSVLGIGLLAEDYSWSDDSVIQNNTINDSAIGILVLADDDSEINNLAIKGNLIDRSLIGVMAANEHDAQMTGLAISGNTISGANELNQVALLNGFLTFADMTEDIEAVTHRDWNPAAFPASGLIGVDVRVNDTDQASVTIEGNRFSHFDQAGLVTIEDATAIPITYNNNTSSDGRYYVAAESATYNLTQAGNTPSPVVIIP